MENFVATHTGGGYSSELEDDQTNQSGTNSLAGSGEKDGLSVFKVYSNGIVLDGYLEDFFQTYGRVC